jgi:hypothetical protein
MILTSKQEEGLKTILSRYKAGEKYTVISGYAGTGKAQPVSTMIPTPEGHKRLGDIQPGDYVFDAEGKPTKVLNIFPQGKLMNYKVSLKDGRYCFCNDEHLFNVITANGTKKTISVKDLLKSGLKWTGNRNKFFIPTIYKKPVEYSYKNYRISPYTIGAFLGDGCCKESTLTLSSATDEIPKKIANLENFSIIREREENGYDWKFYFRDNQVNKYGNTAVSTKDFFNEFSSFLVCYSYEKRIPEVYKYGSIEQRYELLQGLFDTDGSIVDNKYFTTRLTSTSLGLLEDVKEILYSLGLSHLTIVEDNRPEKYTKSCYDLYLSIPNDEKYKLFSLKRKKDIALKAKNHNTRTRYDRIAITNIECLDKEEEMVCIYVDNPDHLYLTDNYIVTHNTTLVNFAIKALDVEPEQVAYCAFCGKAAEVLRSKGNEGAMTLHRLLYESFPREGGGFYRKSRKRLDYSIIVVDEVSMVPKTMIDLLLHHKVYVIFLGDPMQLPPVDKDEANDLLDHPHVFLDEVMRQAAESEIIQMTMKIRNKEDIPYFNGKEVIVMPKAQLVDGCYTWADQILTATNQTRKFINDYVRKMHGFSGMPQEGERMICLRNYWEDCADSGESLVNGTTGIIHNPTEGEITIPRWVQVDNHILQSIDCSFEAEGGSIFDGVRMDKHLIEVGDKCVDWRTSYRLGQLRNRIGDIVPREFDFGYAITCHKAQGSQWGKVLVIEEGFPRDRIEHARWLYTACTRPENKLVLVR